MHAARLHPLVATLLLAAITVGCDSARWGIQHVEIGVLDLDSNLPLADARITCAPAKRQGPSTLYDLTLDQCLDRFSDQSRLTDASGCVGFDIEISVIRGGLSVWLGLDPVKLEDQVTGTRYHFRVENERETLTVPMVPGECVTGEHYEIVIHAIGAPREMKAE